MSRYLNIANYNVNEKYILSQSDDSSQEEKKKNFLKKSFYEQKFRRIVWKNTKKSYT